MLTQAEKEFVNSNLHGDVAALALKLGWNSRLNVRLVLQQIAGFQAIEHKIPSWYEHTDLLFPKSLSLEQCSSEATAVYKQKLVARLRGMHSMADLTGGFGVDCSFLASGMDKVLYVERQSELCELAEKNFRVLSLPQIQIVQGDGVDVLSSLSIDAPLDLIFLDPARRDSKGGKVVALQDCEPDLTRIKSLLLERAGYVLVKLSPMLDISLALKSLPETVEIHVVSVDGECKELLFLLKGGAAAVGSEQEPPIHCVNLRSPGQDQVVVFTRSEELNAQCLFSESPASWLYEPNASVLKAGAFSVLCQAYGVRKLHPNSHLYTSEQPVVNFPGRIFSVKSFFPFHPRDLKQQLNGLTQANITVRNFPDSVADVRKKTRLRDGGEVYIFATTLLDERKVLICCRKDS